MLYNKCIYLVVLGYRLKREYFVMNENEKVKSSSLGYRS